MLEAAVRCHRSNASGRGYLSQMPHDEPGTEDAFPAGTPGPQRVDLLHAGEVCCIVDAIPQTLVSENGWNYFRTVVRETNVT